MLKSFHHRLLVSGFLLLAGAGVVTLSSSNETGVREASVPVRVSSGARAPRGESASSIYSSSAAGKHHHPSSTQDTGLAEDFASGPQSAENTVPQPELPIAGNGFDESGAVQSADASVTAGFSAPDISFAGDQPWIGNDPSTPGSRVSFNNQTVSVTAAQPVPGTPDVALSVVVEDLPPLEPTAGESTEVPVVEAGDGSVPPEPDPVVRRGGFTHEQELFRTKWGWAAFSQVQKLLREETSD